MFSPKRDCGHERDKRALNDGEPQPLKSRRPFFGDKPVKFQVVCPQNGTAVLNGFTRSRRNSVTFAFFGIFRLFACLLSGHGIVRRVCINGSFTLLQSQILGELLMNHE